MCGEFSYRRIKDGRLGSIVAQDDNFPGEIRAIDLPVEYVDERNGLDRRRFTQIDLARTAGVNCARQRR